MSWFFQVFFNEYCCITKVFQCYRLCRFKCTYKFILFINCTHTDSSTTCRRFDDYRISDCFSNFLCLFNIGNSIRSTFNNRNTCIFHDLFGSDLISHFFNMLSFRTNQFDSILFTLSSKFRIFS